MKNGLKRAAQLALTVAWAALGAALLFGGRSRK